MSMANTIGPVTLIDEIHALAPRDHHGQELPRWDFDYGTLFNGEFGPVVDEVSDQQFGLVLCDPPWLPAALPGMKQETGAYHEASSGEYALLLVARDTLEKAMEISKQAAVFSGEAFLPPLARVANEYGWRWHILSWRKNAGRVVSPLTHKPEFVFYCTRYDWSETQQRQKGKAHLNPVLDFPIVGSKERVHASQKPVPLYQHLIEALTLPGEGVIDFFAGSCPIIGAATAAQRPFVAVEKNPQVFADVVALRKGEGEVPRHSKGGGGLF